MAHNSSDIVVIDDSGGDTCAKQNDQPVPSSTAKAKKTFSNKQAWDTLSKFIDSGVETNTPQKKKAGKSKGFRKRKSLVPYHYDGDRNDAAVYSKVREKAKSAMLQEDEVLRRALLTVRKIVPNQAASDMDIKDFIAQSEKSLVPALVRLFSNESLADWIKRFLLYNEALSVVREISYNVFCAKLLLKISDLLVNIKNQANTFSRLNMAAMSSHIVEQEQIMSCSVVEVSETVVKTIAKARELRLLSSSTTSIGGGPRCKKRTKFSHRTSSASSSTDGFTTKSAGKIAVNTLTSDDQFKEHYASVLQAKRFQMVSASFQKHVFSNKIKGLNKTFQNPKAIMAELSSLHASLPVHWASSIFVKCSEQCNLLKALIIGPPDTPYENGCFEFDIFLPQTYPNVNPEVLLVTTGGGRVRFNPNLYKDGKVCLSLLGTWDGPGWIPKESSLLQVLMSIQSLILVKDPYFNEPGYENSRDTQAGKKAAEEYSRTIRSHTLRCAMLEQIKKVHESPFKDIILTHFQLKSTSIKDQMKLWKNKVAVKCARTVMRDLKVELDKLLLVNVGVGDDNIKEGDQKHTENFHKKNVETRGSSSVIDLT